MAGVVTLMFVLSVGLSSVGATVSYFNDKEVSTGNKLQAGVLNFNIFSIGDVLGAFRVAQIESTDEEDETTEDDEGENIGSEEFNITVGDGEGSLPATYTVSGVLDPTNPVGCDKLDITASLGEYSYSGPFILFKSTQISEMGEWQFIVSLPEDNGELAPGAICRGEIVFNAGLAQVAEDLINTFSDEKKYQFKIINLGEEEEEKEVPALDIQSTFPSEEQGEEESGEEGEKEGGEEVIEETPAPVNEEEEGGDQGEVLEGEPEVENSTIPRAEENEAKSEDTEDTIEKAPVETSDTTENEEVEESEEEEEPTEEPASNETPSDQPATQ